MISWGSSIQTFLAILWTLWHQAPTHLVHAAGFFPNPALLPIIHILVPKQKKCLSSTLDHTWQKWIIRKHQCIALGQHSVLGSAGLISNSWNWSHWRTRSIQMHHVMVYKWLTFIVHPALDAPIPNELDSSHMSLVKSRPWKLRANQQFPLHFWDLLPLPLPALSLSSVAYAALSPAQTIALVIP